MPETATERMKPAFPTKYCSARIPIAAKEMRVLSDTKRDKNASSTKMVDSANARAVCNCLMVSFSVSTSRVSSLFFARSVSSSFSSSTTRIVALSVSRAKGSFSSSVTRSVADGFGADAGVGDEVAAPSDAGGVTAAGGDGGVGGCAGTSAAASSGFTLNDGAASSVAPALVSSASQQRASAVAASSPRALRASAPRYRSIVGAPSMVGRACSSIRLLAAEPPDLLCSASARRCGWSMLSTRLPWKPRSAIVPVANATNDSVASIRRPLDPSLAFTWSSCFATYERVSATSYGTNGTNLSMRATNGSPNCSRSACRHAAAHSSRMAAFRVAEAVTYELLAPSIVSDNVLHVRMNVALLVDTLREESLRERSIPLRGKADSHTFCTASAVDFSNSSRTTTAPGFFRSAEMSRPSPTWAAGGSTRE
mmetsp:Transcript_28084/g.87017  ORF Transcript_28084/g.87017 Transcript_28084/m.87017 type:complete len:424 (+) Transcript_28084:100-1371(+)